MHDIARRTGALAADLHVDLARAGIAVVDLAGIAWLGERVGGDRPVGGDACSGNRRRVARSRQLQLG